MMRQPILGSTHGISTGNEDIPQRSWPDQIRLLAALTLVALLVLLLGGAVPVSAQVVDTFFVLDPTLHELRKALFAGLINQVGTLPTPHAEGFAYIYHPRFGTRVPATAGFGPLFADRAWTTGRSTITVSASYSRHTFDHVDGVGLRTGDITATVVGGVRSNVLRFRETVWADVLTIVGLYGLTDDIDVGITVPILKVSVRERVKRVSFQDCFPDLDRCDPIRFRDDSLLPTRAESMGPGDIVLRGKYRFREWSSEVGDRSMALATILDLRVPTGNTGNRSAFINPELIAVGGNRRAVDSFFTLGDPPLGTGIVRVKPQLVLSGLWPAFSSHINLGAELGQTEGITNDLVYAIGASYAVAKGTTFVVDVLGRHAFHVTRRRITREFGATGKPANADTVTASVGVKANPLEGFLVFLNLLIPLNETGMRDHVTPTLGLEWNF